MARPLVLAIDQGTSSTKCLLVDDAGQVVARGAAPLGEQHPRPGWVEQDAEEIWASVRAAVAACLAGQDARAVAAVGISNQREAVVAWDAATGAPLGPLLSWQDQRTAAACDALRDAGHDALIRERSGLPLDPMFSAAKAGWLLDQLDPDRRRARDGAIRLGTVDSWLLSRLGGEHLVEAGNASRTQLLDVRRCAWDDELLSIFRVPRQALPRVVPSTGPFPATRGLDPLPDGVPVLAVMGDSHSALFAHGAFAPGPVKATYGTGSSVMGLIAAPQDLANGLCLTIAWSLGAPAFAAEANIRATGATLRWMADLLGMDPGALAELGGGASADGVTVVPAFTGLGAPWWDRDAVGVIAGCTLGTGKAQLARAALESIPHQICDVLDAMDRSVGRVSAIHADGGPTRNGTLMQLQADLAGRPVLASRTAELSAMGVAHLAGLRAGLWTQAGLEALARPHEAHRPRAAADEVAAERRRWAQALSRARGHEVTRP